MNTNDNQKKLHRSQSSKMIAGVCGGVAEYFNLDPLLVRIIWLIACLANGIGFVAYIVFLIIVPQNPEQTPVEGKKKSESAPLFIGIALVLAGLLFLSRNFFDLFWFFEWPWLNIFPFSWGIVWPAVLILFGVWFIWNAQKKDSSTQVVPEKDKTSSHYKELRRSKTSKMLAGVCGGLAQYWELDVTLIRVGLVLLALITNLWLAVIGYVVFIIAVHEEN
jgi:phage shock protein C